MYQFSCILHALRVVPKIYTGGSKQENVFHRCTSGEYEVYIVKSLLLAQASIIIITVHGDGGEPLLLL